VLQAGSGPAGSFVDCPAALLHRHGAMSSTITERKNAMSLMSFLKDAGEKLFGGKDTQGAAPAAAPGAADNLAALNATAGKAIESYINQQKLQVSGLQVVFDGAHAAVTVRGEAADQATREKVVLCCGNVHGVSQVHDEMTVSAAATPESTYHTVKSGDTLSKIAKEAYGNANAYMKIFEANKPMLSDPDKIYPGQVLRIPAA
jgi:nucleoid-associated protein YgaU